ncbi:MAG: hypothetical protein UIM24_00125 [Clostridia bacterium]|nr:hypothetical protein [Clostridia bacterium]
MELLSFTVVVVMAIRCITFGISTITERNITGGIATIAVAIGSVVCGSAVFY